MLAFGGKKCFDLNSEENDDLILIAEDEMK